MSDSADTIKYDHHAEIMEVNWNINHEEKMKRTTDRVRILTNENTNITFLKNINYATTGASSRRAGVYDDHG